MQMLANKPQLLTATNHVESGLKQVTPSYAPLRKSSVNCGNKTYPHKIKTSGLMCTAADV